MGWVCGTHGREVISIQDFAGKMWRNVNVKEPGWVVVDWLFLSHNENDGLAVGNERKQ